MANDSNPSASPVSPKPRSRPVSSRFLSKSLNGPPEPNSASFSSDSPRGAPRRSSVSLADHIGKDRIRDKEDHHLHHHRQNQVQNQKPANKTPPPPPTATTTGSSVLTKQRSCREFNFSNSENNSKENDRPIIGRSMSGRFTFPGKSSSLVKKSSFGYPGDSPGRLSLEENSFSSDDSLMMRKKALSRPNSPLTGYLSSKSQWALSPGRSGSPPMPVGSKGNSKPLSFSSLRPSGKGVERILNKGLDLFRSKKSSSASSSEAVHQLRLLDNRLIQWRFANARADAVNENMSRQAESTLTSALDGLTKLRESVMQKRIQVEREKLELKLNLVLQSQMKLLDSWEGMERPHLAALEALKESLWSVACKVPLLEGAKVDIQLASIAQADASDLLDTIKSSLSGFSHSADETAKVLSELAKVVAQEKLLLQEYNDIFPAILALKVEERSLRCSLIQLGS